MGILQQVSLSEHAPCFTKCFQERSPFESKKNKSTWVSCSKSVCPHKFRASQKASGEGLASSCRPASCTDWQVAFAAQGSVHDVACETPFEARHANPHVYLAASVFVRAGSVPRKRLPGRVWRPLVGQPLRRIGK